MQDVYSRDPLTSQKAVIRRKVTFTASVKTFFPISVLDFRRWNARVKCQWCVLNLFTTTPTFLSTSVTLQHSTLHSCFTFLSFLSVNHLPQTISLFLSLQLFNHFILSTTESWVDFPTTTTKCLLQFLSFSFNRLWILELFLSF